MSWGPWIEHDGSRPEGIPRRCKLDVKHGSGLFPSEKLHIDSPCWFWRWRHVRVGWFRREWRRVCDQPDFAPVKEYRIWYPDGLALLKEIAADPPSSLVRELS